MVDDAESSTRAMSSRLRRLAPRTHVTPHLPVCRLLYALMPNLHATIPHGNIATHSSTHMIQVITRRLKKMGSGGKESFRALGGLVGMRQGTLKKRTPNLATYLGSIPSFLRLDRRDRISGSASYPRSPAPKFLWRKIQRSNPPV